MASKVSQGIRETNLYHGLKLMSSTPLVGKFSEICYCSETQEYLVLETGSMVHRYSMQGKPIRPPYQLGVTMLFTRMLWCSVAKVLACYIPHDDMIWIMNTSCKLLQIVRNEFRIEELFYSSIINELFVVGPNKITNYPMQDVDHPLNSIHTISYVDSNFGSLWRIEYSSLIEQTPTLTMAGSYLTTIYIMSLKPESIMEGASSFIATKLDATVSSVTALYYHQMSEWIICGDQQGNISGWNLELECVMSCPSGHESPVRLIIRHPSICGFLTISNDKCLQVWSCNLREKMESFCDIGDIWSVTINDSVTSLATIGTKLNCFHMLQLYLFYATLSAPAVNLYSTRNPTFPTRTIVACSDNTVAMLSSLSGRRINVQILSPKLQVSAASYSGITNRMYTIILKTGEILVSSAKTKPMTLKHVWVDDDLTITCIIAYETFDKIEPIDKTQRILIKPVSTLIVVGTSDGKLVTIEEASGRHINVVSAHAGPVIDISSSTISRQVVSVGKDNCVKIWRICPDITTSLVLIDSVYYIAPITRVASLKFTICLVNDSEKSKVHRIIMYDTFQRVKLSHHPSKEHSALITSIATLETLEICASSSIDKTIRIWNQLNELLKVFRINTTPQNLIFSSLRGDIVFSCGKHLFRVPHENYLSPEYRVRIYAEEIAAELEDEILEENVNYRIYEEEVDREKILHPVSSTPFGSLDTTSDAPKLEHMMLKQMSLNQRYKDEDIQRIKEGTIKGLRLVGNKSMMSNEVWEKHIAELLGSTIPTETVDNVLSDENILENEESLSPVVKKTYNEPEIFRMIHGYSVPDLENYMEELQEYIKYSKVLFSRFLPNSLIYKIEKEPEIPEVEHPVEKRKFKYRYPPEVLLKDKQVDSQDNLGIPLTLSQLAYLDIDEEEMFDE